MQASRTPRSEKDSSEQHWERVYRSRPEQKVSWYQAFPGLSLKLIKHAGLAVDDPLIDVGGGASALVGCLLDSGYQDVSVMDISTLAIQKSQQRLGERAAQARWITADITSFKPLRQYALWHDRALFHFMTGNLLRRSYVKALDQALRPGGQAIIATFAKDGPRRCSGLDTLQCNATQMLQELGAGFELMEERQEFHQTPDDKQQSFSYFRFKKQI